jgi:hypothetical protein
MLALVGGLAVSLLLSRHSTSHRAVARQIDSYRDHHRGAGVKECILRWVDTARNRMDESIALDGHAFTMRVQGEAGAIGGTVQVYLADAQGTLVSETSTLSGRRREIVEAAKFLLESIPPERRLDETGRDLELFRPAGPAELSINSAPDLVIQAVCMAIVELPEKAVQAAEAIIRERDHAGVAPVELTRAGRTAHRAAREGLTPDPAARMEGADVMKALGGVPITEQERREIAGMFVTRPTLYRCVAETRDASDRLLDRSAGLYLLEEGKTDTFKQGGAFLSWESLAIDPAEQ